MGTLLSVGHHGFAAVTGKPIFRPPSQGSSPASQPVPHLAAAAAAVQAAGGDQQASVVVAAVHTEVRNQAVRTCPAAEVHPSNRPAAAHSMPQVPAVDTPAAGSYSRKAEERALGRLWGRCARSFRRRCRMRRSGLRRRRAI